MAELAAHSPLGASGAARWMRCPGSVTLSYGVPDEESDDAALGTAAHALASACLEANVDAWEEIGWYVFGGKIIYPPDDPMVLGMHMGTSSVSVELVDQDMADAVQVYLDFIRKSFPDRDQGNHWVERRFHCPELHELFYGTADDVYFDEPRRTLHVTDYKHGIGIVVDAPWNAQALYYAVGALANLDLWHKVDHIVIHIVQPRGWHVDGDVRSWGCTIAELKNWLVAELLPAMDKAMVSRETVGGEHCRFCPARRRACPAMGEAFKNLEETMDQLEKEPARVLTSKEQARFLDSLDMAKIAGKAIEKDVFNKINAGKKVPGRKIVSGKANRQFKVGAVAALEKQFGDEAYVERTIRSPAQIDKLPGGKAFTTRYAFKPPVGGTLVREDNSRTAISPDTKGMFQPVKGKRK